MVHKENYWKKLDHEEVYEDNWEVKHNRDPYLRMDVLSSAFIYARHSEYMQEMTGFGREDCLSLHSSGGSFLMAKNTGSGDERIYTQTDKFTRHFVHQSIKGGKVGAFNHLLDHL